MVKVQFLSERVNSLSLLCRGMSYLVSLFFQIQDPCHCGNESFCSSRQNILSCVFSALSSQICIAANVKCWDVYVLNSLHL